MLAYYYHENSDCIFIDHLNRDFGLVESDYVHKIGLCFRAEKSELIKRLWTRKARGKLKSIKFSEVSIDYEKPYLPF